MADRGSTAVKPPAREPATKKCPMCAELIRAEAKVCRYCGAHFTVTSQGYCPVCHRVSVLDADGRCGQCHGDVVDRQFVSELAVTAPAPPAAAAAPAAPAAAAAAPALAATAPVAPAAPAEPALAVAPRGSLRTGYIGNQRQTLGEALVGIGMVACLLTTALGWGGTDFFLLGLNKGVEEARPGPWFLFVPLIAVAVGSRQLRPRRTGLMRPGWPKLRSQYGIKRLYMLDGARRRAIIGAVLWAGTLVLAIVMGSVVSNRGMTVEPGTYILLIASLVGLAGSLLFLPGRDNTVVQVDDEGNLFQA